MNILPDGVRGVWTTASSCT